MSLIGLLLIVFVVVCVVWWLQSAPINMPPILKWLLTGIIMLTADTVLVEAIADSLSDEDVMKLGSALKPELIGPLMGRFEVYQKKKLADAQARESLKGFTPDNEYNEETPEPKKLPSGKKKTG